MTSPQGNAANLFSLPLHPLAGLISLELILSARLTVNKNKYQNLSRFIFADWRSLERACLSALALLHRRSDSSHTSPASCRNTNRRLMAARLSQDRALRGGFHCSTFIFIQKERTYTVKQRALARQTKCPNRCARTEVEPCALLT